jgi:hypothetical protein
LSHFDQSSGGARQAPTHAIIDFIQNSALAQVLYVATELRIADHLASAAMQMGELSQVTGAHEPSQRRLMRALVALGLCIEREDGFFALSEAGLPLRTSASDSLHCWLLWFGRHQWAVWGQLLHTVRTGESARKRLTGSSGFALFERDPQAASLFNMALAELTQLIAETVVRVYDFTGIKSVVDVGGGHGALLAEILKSNPDVFGVLVDRPHAIEGARKHLQQAGVANRSETVPGDFFASVPAGADLYVLKNIIHDWDDESALLILRNCRRAMRGYGKLLLVERVLPARLKASPAHRGFAHADLTMMLGPGGRERTEAEIQTLLHDCGLELIGIKPVELGYSLLEASLPSASSPPVSCA